jgi:dihydroorotate dehydrogenase (NAD+) catalytic subunit
MQFTTEVERLPLPKILAPIYDIRRSYAENLSHGPSFGGMIPQKKAVPESQWIDFMGCKAASPIGVPAGPLLNSQWTSLAAALGFDIVTYKTIRSQAYPSHPLPNVIHVEQCLDDPESVFESHTPSESSRISITNSFGMPSMSPEYLQNDIALARRQLDRGQILIVSVVGTPGCPGGIAEDFVRAALLAKEAGAQIIEANFSCPNISSKEGSLFCDSESAFLIASRLVKAINPLPLLVKVGNYPGRELLLENLKSLARANVRGVCGINSLPRHVLDHEGKPALGKDRETSGICGDLIRPCALEFLKDASRIIAEERLDLELAGCGGIMQAHHFDEFLNAGAKVAMCATGMMWDPYLAVKWKDSQK